MSQIYLENWLKKTEIDYYQMFIFSWIPFNAWYVKNYYDYDNNIVSDKDIIGKIKNEENPFRSKIINLLNGSNQESIDFRTNIANLHTELESNTIPNQEKRISFSSLKTNENPKRQEIIQHYSKKFKFEYLHQLPRVNKRFKCTLLRSDGSAEWFIEIHRCVNEEIEIHEEYINKTPQIQTKIKQGFNEINPNKPNSIIGSRNNGLKISNDLFFINNPTLVSKFLVELLYQLRCKIFHGEIDPKPAYYNIYKYAYLIINPLIKTLN